MSRPRAKGPALVIVALFPVFMGFYTLASLMTLTDIDGRPAYRFGVPDWALGTALVTGLFLFPSAVVLYASVALGIQLRRRWILLFATTPLVVYILVYFVYGNKMINTLAIFFVSLFSLLMLLPILVDYEKRFGVGLGLYPGEEWRRWRRSGFFGEVDLSANPLYIRLKPVVWRALTPPLAVMFSAMLPAVLSAIFLTDLVTLPLMALVILGAAWANKVERRMSCLGESSMIAAAVLAGALSRRTFLWMRVFFLVFIAALGLSMLLSGNVVAVFSVKVTILLSLWPILIPISVWRAVWRMTQTRADQV